MNASICSHFGVCGGCSKQNVAYDNQLSTKQMIVHDHLEKLFIHEFHPILPSPDIYFYRNKMEFSFGDEKDIEILGRVGERSGVPALGCSDLSSIVSQAGFGAEPERRNTVHLGLHPKGRFALVTPTPECRLLSEDSRKICAVVEDWATENKVPVFVRKSQQGDLRHLVIREGKGTSMRMVNLVAKSTTAAVDGLAERLRKSGLPITTFMWTPYDGLSDVARGGGQKVYWGDGRIDEKIGGLTFKVNPESFMQTNTRAAEMMIDVLRRWIVSGKTLIDVYCGSGAIGLSLAKYFQEVIGIEINKSAVEDARQNAQLNGITNARFMDGKAEELAPALPVKESAANTTVVVDPPRAGLHPKMLSTLMEWNVPTILYVSCNPESLARDLRVLSTRYDILDVQPMDFFPHTDHIETAVRLKIRSS